MENSRRDFIKGLGVISMATMVPASISSCVYKNGDTVKVRLIFAVWDDVQVQKTWPNVGYDFRSTYQRIADALNARIPDVQFLPAKARNAETLEPLMQQDDEVDGYMVIQMNSWPDVASPLSRMTEKPLLFCSWPYSGIGGWDTSNAAIIRSGRKNYGFISSFDFDDMIEAARCFCVIGEEPERFADMVAQYRISNMPDPSQLHVLAKTGHRDCLTPSETMDGVKGMKIISVQLDDKAMFDQVKKDFGIDVISMSYDKVEAATNRANVLEAKKIADSWRKKADFVEPVTEDRLLGCAKMYLGMKSLLKENNAQAITISCIPGCYEDSLTNYPCLGFMQLQDEGLFGVCEDDIQSTVTMMVFTKMTKGLMGFVSDPVIDSSKRAVIYAHCVSTRKFFGPDGMESPFEILTHSEDRLGASVRTIAPVGHPITSLEFNFANKLMAIQTGITVGNDFDDRACRTKIVAEISGDFEKIYNQWDIFGWHRVSFLGDFAEEARALAEHIGYTVVEEC